MLLKKCGANLKERRKNMDKKQVGKVVGAGMLAGTAGMAVTNSLTD